ncbi:OmpA family protein [Herbaspirillum lusitanum]|uniref:OmpA family protein n=1 Tax=Herbaspirillum lusitanum TaxID=213312 RepID=A0ABW9A669_9BURK
MQKKNSKLQISVALACCLVSTGCAVDPKTGQMSFKETFASDDPCANNARNIGIVAGGVLGALIGNQVDKKAGTLIGAGAGALIGGLIGADMDRKKCELSKLAKKYDLELTFTDIPAPSAATQSGAGKAEPALGLSVSIKDQDLSGHFVSGSDELQPKALKYFTEIAAEYSYPQQLKKLPPNATAEMRSVVESLREKRLLIVGHTDDTGSSQLNADLSERRARSVAKVFQAAGIQDARIFFQGAGETQPIADNRSEDGRARNRRVEIVDLTDEGAFRQYLAARSVRTDFYRIALGSEVADATAAQQANKASKANSGNIPKQTAKQIAKPAQAQRAKANANAGKAATESSSAPAAVPAITRQAQPSAQTAAALDFGGSPAGSIVPKLDLGAIGTSRSSAGVIGTAQASDTPMSQSCRFDKPRIANGVKSLRDGKEIATSEYMPGLYNTSWVDKVNGHLVALTNVAVLRDGGAPARQPKLLIYKNYASANAKPDYTIEPQVNTYKGDKALLYRVFASGPVRCMDIVIPNDSPRSAEGSWLYYDNQGNALISAFNPKIAK